MFEKWIAIDVGTATMVILSCAGTFVAVLIFTRMVGLRSFSKMSAADFAVTVAIGSLIASTVSAPNPALTVGILALAALYFAKWALSLLRQRFKWFSRMIDNEPLLLMAGDQMIDENLRKSQVTRADVYAKLRESNACNYDKVLAVIFETTGDISVIHSEDPQTKLERDFFGDVRDSELLFDDRTDGDD